MTLTIEEETILRKQIEIKKREHQLQNVVLTQPALIPTKDVEISTLKQQIKAEEVHTTRVEYVKKVQPMKDNYRALIVQNKQIKIDNKAEIDAARSTDELVKQGILNNINVAKNELNTLLGEI
jgi:hypothetical protein